MHKRCGEDFEGFNASDSPDNASPRERGKRTLESTVLCSIPLFFLHNYRYRNAQSLSSFPRSTWHHSTFALQDQQDQSGQTRSAACSCVQGRLSSPAQR
jgi:hypothetical protein